MAYDHWKLKALIDSDEDNLGRTNQQVLNWLNTPRVVDGRANMQDVIRYMAEEGIWAAMASSSDIPVQAFKDELDMLAERLDTIDTKSARFAAAMDVMVGAGLLTAEQQAAIAAMAEESRTPLQEAGISKAVAGDVLVARNLH